MAGRGFEITTGLVIRQGIYEESSTAKHPVGTRMQLADGRVYYYAKADASGLTKALLCMSPAVTANHNNQAVAAAAAAGTKSVSCTLGATACTADQYAEGYLVINDAAGEGHYYKIKSHGTSTAGSEAITVTLYDPIQVALTTSSEYTLVPNPFMGITNTATEENSPAGVPMMAVTASYYAWVQTWGVCSVLRKDTTALGAQLIPASTSGGVVGHTATNNVLITMPPVGLAISTGVDTEHNPIFLKLHP